MKRLQYTLRSPVSSTALASLVNPRSKHLAVRKGPDISPAFSHLGRLPNLSLRTREDNRTINGGRMKGKARSKSGIFLARRRNQKNVFLRLLSRHDPPVSGCPSAPGLQLLGRRQFGHSDDLCSHADQLAAEDSTQLSPVTR